MKIRKWLQKLKEETTGDRNSDVLKWTLLYEGMLRKQDLVDLPFLGAKREGDYIKTADWSQKKNSEYRHATFSSKVWEELKEHRALVYPGTTVDRLFPGLTISGLSS